MHFFIKFSTVNNLQDANYKIIENSDSIDKSNILYITGDQNSFKEISLSNGKALFLGDPVFHYNRIQDIYKYLEKRDIGNVIRNVDGFFFLILFCEAEKKLVISSSIFSILPIFYESSGRFLFVSSSYDLLVGRAKDFHYTTDNQYYLEKSIFNYALFDRTPLVEIKTLPSNSFIEYSEKGYCIKKHTNISDYFVSGPIPWRSSLDKLSSLFIENTKAFLPEAEFTATLTGGFDGRAVVSLALAQNSEFNTYSYGSAGDLDVTIPATVSESIKKLYKPVILNNEYAEKHFWYNAGQFLAKSFGSGNISRAHYNYALETRLNKTKYLLTGNFGSEILRSMKMPGVMTSSLLFSIFEDNTLISLRNDITTYQGLVYLNADIINNFLEPLIEDISQYLKEPPDGLTTNQRFYIYMFEEVFRKYFGPEIIVQRNYLHNRSPFLSFAFIEEVLKTELAGANSSFLENNPLKRYHGQVLYSHILKKTYPGLLDQPLDRGYCPRDFITIQGPFKIVFGHFKRNYLKKRDKNLPSYSTSQYELNMNHLRDISFDEDIFNKVYFNKMMESDWKTDQMHFSNMISAAMYNNSLKQSCR